MRTIACILALLAVACVERNAPGGGSELSGGGSEASGEMPTSTSFDGESTSAASSGATSFEGSTTDAEEDSTTGLSCVPNLDVPGECDLFCDACPPGHKCMPYAKDGIGWDATRCSILAAEPRMPGATCTVIEHAASGIDDCVAGAMCWNVDPETQQGTCVAFCEGSLDAPSCAVGSQACIIANGGVLPLCIERCNPLLQDCDPGAACAVWDPSCDLSPCVPLGPEASTVCLPAVPRGDYGAPCSSHQTCSPGLLCAPAAGVPGCQGSPGCCTTFCDLAAAENHCYGVAGGQVCVPVYQLGAAPEGFEDVGACLVP